MANNITVDLKDLFGGKMFRIPNYQRGYSWEERQLEDLWDDINDISRGSDGQYIKHYTGTIYLSATNRSDLHQSEIWAADDEKFYDVVDGQQRLTSIAILMFELIKHAPEGLGQDTQDDMMRKYLCVIHKNQKLKCYRFSYKENNREFLLNKIFEDSSAILPPSWSNVYSKNLLFAKDFFRKKIDNLNPEDLEELYRKLQTAIIFDQRIIEQDLDVQAVFETMNNRGKPLTTLEKLKNRLIFLCNRFTDHAEKYTLHEIINKTWANIYVELAKNPDNPLPEDVFLSAYLSLCRRPKDAVFSETQADDLVFKMFCSRTERYGEAPVDYDKIESFVNGLSEFARFWYEVHNSDEELIKRITIQNGSKEMKIFIATLLLIRERYPQEVESCVEKTELIQFRNSFPIQDVLDYRTFATYARNIYAKPEAIHDVLLEMDDCLAKPCDAQSMVAGFQWLFSYTYGNIGYHRWGGLKYLLFCYEMYLKDQFYNEYTDRVTWNDYWDVNIEHVIPRKCETYWSKEVDEYLDGIPDDFIWRAKVTLINSLGNLSIIKDRKNSELQNDPWESKKERYKSGYYSEQWISEHESWTQDEIYDRGKDIIHFIESRIPGLKFNDSEMLDVLFSAEKFYPTKFREQQNVHLNEQ